LSFRHDSHHHHLPRVQMRARGGCFRRFDAFAPTTTSLAFKHELLGGFFSFFQRLCHHRPLPRFQTRTGGGFFCRFETTPTTSSSLASKRELEVVSFRRFHHLPPPPPSRPNASWRWFLRPFRPPAATPPPSRSNASWRWSFSSFPPSATTTTPLASKREPEVVISSFRCDSHHHHLPRIQMRVGGGPFRRFQGICRRRRHVITARESITAKMDKRGRG